MVMCQKCNDPIETNKIFKWVNSGIDVIKCDQCGKTIANAGHLLVIYIIAGVFTAVGINFITEISNLLLSFGFHLSEIIMLIAIIFLGLFLIFIMAFLTIKNNA